MRHRESKRLRGTKAQLLIRAARTTAFREARGQAVPRAALGLWAEHANTNQLRWISTGGRGLPSTRSTPDANNPLPLMTGEKQCAGFNTGSETGPRSCVVGGHLSTGRRTIAAATASKSSRSSASVAFTVLRGSCRRAPASTVRLYGNAIRRIKTRAHRDPFHPLPIDRASSIQFSMTILRTWASK